MHTRQPFKLAGLSRQFRLVLDSIDLPICYYDTDLVIHFVNRQYADFIGLPEDRILGSPLAAIIGADVMKQVAGYLERALAGEAVTYERTRYWPGRGDRRVRIRLIPDVDEGGAVQGIYAVGHDIDDDHRLRTALREREEQLLRFADNIPEPIIYLDREFRYRFVNRAYLEFRQTTREEIVGRTVAEVRGTAFSAEVRPQIEAALAGKPVLFERHAADGAGNPRWVRVRVVPDFDPSGAVLGVYAVVTDIDEAKRAQEALAEAESRVRLFTDNIPEPLAYLDADDRLTFANQAYLDGVRRPRDQVIGHTIADVLGAEAAEYFAPLVARARRGERVIYERLRLAPDDTMRWVRGVIVPDYNEQGACRGVYLVVHDIHDLKLTQSALAQREMQFRAFMDGIPAPVAYINRNAVYEYVNRAFIEFAERGPHEIQGRSLAEMSLPEDYARQARLLERALAGETIAYERLTTFERRAPRWYQVRLVPERNAEGEVAGVFVLLNDIHSQKESEAAIRHINWVLNSHMENSPMAVLEWDRELRLIRWSRRAEDIFGWTADEVLGSTVLSDWKFVLEDDIAQVQPVIEELLTGGRNASTGVNRNRRKDGTIIWCEWHNSALRDERGNVLSILSFAQDVSDRVDAQARLEAMATHDALTGLPNRVLLHRRLTEVVSRARQRQRQVAILFIDLDRFKNVNDSLGHRIGDELLKLISRRLVLALRKGDFLARLGGDEFTVLLENMTETEGARQVATKLLEVIEQPYWVHGHLVHVSASIGLALFPDDGDDPDTLLKNADVAMYRAKEAGKNVYQFFAQEMGAHQQEKMALENALRQAVKMGALEIALQPKVEIRTGRIVGAEALLRWHDPALGDVGPARFIPVAEEAGLIDIIGDWVLTRACRELQNWAAAGLPAMTVAVNLSVRQFRDPGMSARIERIFAQSGIDPRQIEFEVTESSVLYDADTVSRVLQLERALGVRVAIDDFGTGYSSLVHLKHLPIDTLKIDQSFIRDITTDPDDKAITAAIVALAHSLGLDVVAEGVETAEQLAFLTERGCDYYQGNFFSSPLPPTGFVALVRERLTGDPAPGSRPGLPT